MSTPEIVGLGIGVAALGIGLGYVAHLVYYAGARRKRWHAASEAEILRVEEEVEEIVEEIDRAVTNGA